MRNALLKGIQIFSTIFLFDGFVYHTDGNGLIEINELYTALKEANGKEFNPETCQLLMGEYGNI